MDTQGVQRVSVGTDMGAPGAQGGLGLWEGYGRETPLSWRSKEGPVRRGLNDEMHRARLLQGLGDRELQLQRAAAKAACTQQPPRVDVGGVWGTAVG